MKEKAITLISLVITIVILIILAGISISVLTGENGLMSKANEARKKSEESSAREKLELVLMNANAEKESNSSYNGDEYLTNMLENEGMTVNGDTILVDKYNFLIDREQLIILDGLGETTVNITKEVKEYLGKNANDKYEANILIKINSNVGISKISIENDTENMIEIDALGIQTEIGKDMTVELDKEYKIVVISSDGKETVSKIIEKSEEKISTVDNLIAFRDNVNKGLTYEGKTMFLEGDIDLSTVSYKVDGTVNNDKSWIPIGNETNHFKGIFDGNSYTVSKIYINSTGSYQGLFGYNEGTIKNIQINGNITTKGNDVGGIIGWNTGIITNCINSCKIIGKYDCGGIVGVDKGSVENCANTGEISAYNESGGIVGRSFGTIKNCFNSGYIHSSNFTAGGICGYKIAGNIYNSYNISSIYAKECAGGINGGAGYSAYSKVYTYNCYNLGNITGSIKVRKNNRMG